MQRIKFMYRQFLREPWWFKITVPITLLLSILLSSSLVPDNGYYQGGAKLAAAIFFCSCGINMRRSLRIAAIFFVLAVICIYLSWDGFDLASL